MDDVYVEEVPVSEAFAPGRALRHGFASLKRCFPVLFVGGCLKSCTDGGGGGGGGNYSSLLDQQKDKSSSQLFDLGHQLHRAWAGGLGVQASDDPFAVLGNLIPGVTESVIIGGLLAVVAIVVVALLLFRSWLVPGWIRVHREIVETGNGEFATLFSGADRMFPLLGWSLLAGLIGFGTVALAAAPGAALAIFGGMQGNDWMLAGGCGLAVLLAIPVWVYVFPGLVVGEQAVVLDGLGPVDALARSWAFVDGARGSMILYLLAMFGVRFAAGILGLCMCCIGGFVTNPIAFVLTDFGTTESYLMRTRSRDTAAGWSIQTWGDA